MARVEVEQPLGAARRTDRIAVMVEQREGVAMLERARAPLLQRCRRGDIELRDVAGAGDRPRAGGVLRGFWRPGGVSPAGGGFGYASASPSASPCAWPASPGFGKPW